MAYEPAFLRLSQQRIAVFLHVFHGGDLRPQCRRSIISHGGPVADCSLLNTGASFPHRTFLPRGGSGTMARYFFHIDGENPRHDDRGDRARSGRTIPRGGLEAAPTAGPRWRAREDNNQRVRSTIAQ